MPVMLKVWCRESMNILTKIRQWFYLTPEEEYFSGQQWASYICAFSTEATVKYNYDRVVTAMNRTKFDDGAQEVFSQYFREKR